MRLRRGHQVERAGREDFVNAKVGKTQRLADVRVLTTLPRSAIGKILKRELRDSYLAAAEG